MVIQHNIAALNSHRNLGVNNSATNKNLEKLSSGFRINRAGDDAAGLAISEKMRGQIRGLAMAEQNAANGISLIQTAEGGLNETHAILQRMRELAVQASNGTYQNDDRQQIQHEIDALVSEIDRISTSTHYNGIQLLDGNLSDKVRADMANVRGDAAALAGVKVNSGASAGDTFGIGNATYTAAAAATSTTIVYGGTNAVALTAGTTATTTGNLSFTITGGAAVNVGVTAGESLGTIQENILTALNNELTDSTASFDSSGRLVLTSTTPGNSTIADVVAFTTATVGNVTVTLGAAGGATTGLPAVDEALSIELADSGNGSNDTVVLGTDGKVVGTNWIVEDSNGNEFTIDLAAFRAAEAANAGDGSLIAATVAGIEGENLVFQIGANGTADQQVDLEIRDMGAGALGVANLNLRTRVDANAAIDLVDAATNLVSTQRAQLGALQNRLEHTLNNLGVTKENLTAAESTIRDVDMAKEMMEFTKNSILVQASQAMLAQANSLPQGVLSLLR